MKSVSQLDYSTQSILVNNKPFIPVGFYAVWMGSFEALKQDLSDQAAQGVNVVMLCALPSSSRLDFLSQKRALSIDPRSMDIHVGLVKLGNNTVETRG